MASYMCMLNSPVLAQLDIHIVCRAYAVVLMSPSSAVLLHMCCKQKHGRKREALPLCIYVFVSVSLFLVRLICIYVFEVADCSDVLMPEIFLNSLASVLTATFPKFCCSVFLHESLELLIVEI